MKRLIIGLVIIGLSILTTPVFAADNSVATSHTSGNTTYYQNSAGNQVGSVTTNGSVTTYVINNPQTGTVNQGN